MAQVDLFRGVPRSVLTDGWWLSADAEFAQGKPPRGRLTQGIWSDRGKRRMGLLLVLLLLADFLFFREAVGVSIALFVVAVFVASVLEAEKPRAQTGPVVLLVLSVLPIVEHTQFVSLVFAIGGLITAVAWNRVGFGRSIETVSYAARWLLFLIPIEGLRDCIHGVKLPGAQVDSGGNPRKISGLFRGFVRNWAFPLGGGAVILSLLILANPVFEGWIDGLLEVDFDLSVLVMRALFWGGMGLVIWPFLSVTAAQLTLPSRNLRSAKARLFGLNAQSVSNALWLFNGLLAVQLLMDGQVFWGGSLPEGVSYARYAHRGAYPLLVTALLAGLFALAARPLLAEGRHLKTLMMVWLGLNVLLTMSSMARLDLYVEAYGLTYLRVRAGIWMGLVAVWLGMIAWQIGREKGNGWLLGRSFGLGIVVIYICSFVNFAEVIAAHNYDKARISDYSFCQYVGTSKSAYLRTDKGARCRSWQYVGIEGWRDWDYRRARLLKYIKADKAQGVNHENSGR